MGLMMVGSHLDEFRSSGQSCTDVNKGCVGGYARVKTVIDATRPTKKNSLFLNAGDEFQASYDPHMRHHMADSNE